MRITKETIEFQVEALNSLLGVSNNRNTVGAYFFQRSEGVFALRRTANNEGGAYDIASYNTIKGLHAYLSGMIAVLRDNRLLGV